MNKEFIKRLLESPSITEQDLNTFIQEYTLEKKKRDITGQELLAISQMIKGRFFDLRFALLEAAKDLDLNVITAIDKNGVIVKTHVYESF